MANIQKADLGDLVTLKSFSELVDAGTLPPKPSALSPEDVEGRRLLWDLSTLKVEQFKHKLGGVMPGVRVMTINPETGERKLLMTASASIHEQVTEQIVPSLNAIPSLLPVTIVGEDHQTIPGGRVWRLT